MSVFALFALLALTGCGVLPGEGECTLAAAREGVGVEVAAGLDAADATVEVCTGQTCRTVPVTLRPFTVAAGTTCEGGGPSAVCSAEVRRTGGSQGFADVPDLPGERVRVTVTVTDAGDSRLAHGSVTATPRTVSPNGPGCGGAAPQLDVTVAADGTVRAD